MNDTTYTLNIGLHVENGDNGPAACNERATSALVILQSRAEAELVRMVRKPIGYLAQVEDGLVIDFNSPLPLHRLHLCLTTLSNVLEQDCLALRENNLGEGWLLGKSTAHLGAFDDRSFNRSFNRALEG